MSGDPKGEWACTVKGDRQRMARAEQMMGGVRKEQTHRGKEYHASIDKERVTYPDGSKREIYEHLLDSTKAKVKGMRGVGRHGGAPTEFFAIAAPKHVQGPDGLWFVWNDGWEPTNLWRRSAASPQRDPDENVWLEVDGEWKLLDEELAWRS